jgi:sialic acid synthase SpsE
MPFFVAELGICHGGKVETALALAEAAIGAGAHCVKTETFESASMIRDPSAMCSYVIRGKRFTVPLKEHMDRYSLTLEEHRRVRDFCRGRGVPFMATVHDFKSVDFMAAIGTDAFKIASPDIVHVPLLRHVARFGIPVFLDTGSALAAEIAFAVRTLVQAGLNDVVVNHNPAGHPAPASGHDLRIMDRLRSELGVPIGLADHYEGYEMLYAATALGADTLEKPVSFDRFVEECERNWSIDAADLPEVLRVVREVSLSLGCAERHLSDEQRCYRDTNRMACFAARNLPAGSALDLGCVLFGRPRLGIGVEHWDMLEGRALARPLAAGEPIRMEDLA